MKSFRIYLPLICVLLFFSCKKVVEDQKRQAVMSFITNGQWKIQSYLVDTVSITAEFEGYTFKFNDNGTVVGDNGSTSAMGTWSGDVSDYSITSEFSGAGDPCQKLNGHWIIKDSGLTFVKADLKTTGATMHLHLVKVP
jgi:hypothetical protein